MPPEPEEDLAAALTDPARAAHPRVWEAAVRIRLGADTPVLRTATSRHHRTTGYEVGPSVMPALPLSKPLGLPHDLTERDLLRAAGAFRLAAAESRALEDDLRLLTHACVIVTVGARRAALVDTQRRSLAIVPAEIGRLLADMRGALVADVVSAARGMTEERARHWLGAVVAADLAFCTSEPADRFPPVNLEWKTPATILAAVVDIGPGSDHDLAALVGELDGLGCQRLELRYWMPVGAERVDRDLRATTGSRLRAVVVMAPWEGFGDEDDIEALCVEHGRLAQLTLHGAPAAQVLGDRRYRVVCLPRTPAGPDGCGEIHPLYFGLDLESVLVARAGDSCLLDKVGIAMDGSIRNCPSHPTPHGRLGETPLADVVVRSEFAGPGSLTKAEVAGCRVCEFRDVCSHCQVRADHPTAKPGACRYDPYTAVWDER